MGKEKTKLKPINTPVYGYWSALYRSFYSRYLYVDVGTRWKGLGLLYLLLTVALCSVPFFFRISANFGHSFQEQITDPLSKIPVFYIQKGEVSFDKPMPYFIKNDKGQVLAAIDTTGKINQFSTVYPDLTILINKDKISFKIPSPQFLNISQTASDKNSPLIQPFDKGTNLVFDGKKLAAEKAMAQLKYTAQALIYPLLVAIFFSVFIVFFMVLGFLGQVFSQIFFSFKVGFMQSTRLLIVAGTPMIILLLLMFTFNWIFQGVGIILFALLILYYCFALHCLKAASRQVAIS